MLIMLVFLIVQSHEKKKKKNQTHTLMYIKNITNSLFWLNRNCSIDNWLPVLHYDRKQEKLR